MQKKAIYGLVLAGLISGSALAGMPDMPPPVQFHPFVGVNYSYMSLTTPANAAAGAGALNFRLPESYSGINFEGGLKYGHYLGMAFGYTHHFSQSRTIGANAAVTAAPENFYWDLIGYYPVMDNFNLLASIGAQVTDMASTTAATGVSNGDNTTVNFRFGVGANYFFTHNWGVQAVWNYVPNNNYVRPTGAATFNGRTWDSLWTIRVGVYYMFN